MHFTYYLASLMTSSSVLLLIKDSRKVIKLLHALPAGAKRSKLNTLFFAFSYYPFLYIPTKVQNPVTENTLKYKVLVYDFTQLPKKQNFSFANLF